jgi:MFS family permease
MLHKSALLVRWAILLCACLVSMAIYYTFDNPSPLQQDLETYFTTGTGANGTGTFTQDDFATFFNNMYSFYSLPNMILPLFGGVLIDIIGARVLIIILISLVTAGQILTAFGISLKSTTLALCGRFLFGLGAETLNAALTTIQAQWFKGKELAFAMGISLSIARLGTVFNNIISPELAASSLGISGTFYFGVLILLVAILLTCIMYFIDKRAENYISMHKVASM